MNADFKYKELTHRILKCAFEVHNTLGCGFLEKVYENALVHELEIQHIECKIQKSITVIYKNKEVGKYIADIVVENKVILEVKTVDQISNIHRAQLINYLRATGYEVGIIINFAKTKLEYQRLVLSKNK